MKKDCFIFHICSFSRFSKVKNLQINFRTLIMFPPEIYIMIFSFILSVDRQQRLREVCKLFHSLIKKKLYLSNITEDDIETLSNDDQYGQMIINYIKYVDFESDTFEFCLSCKCPGYVETFSVFKPEFKHACPKCLSSKNRRFTENKFDIIAQSIQSNHLFVFRDEYDYKAIKFLKIFSKRKQFELYFRFYYFIKTFFYNCRIIREIAYGTFVTDELVRIIIGLKNDFFSRGMLLKHIYLCALRRKDREALEILNKYCFKKLRKDCERILRRENEKDERRRRKMYGFSRTVSYIK